MRCLAISFLWVVMLFPGGDDIALAQGAAVGTAPGEPRGQVQRGDAPEEQADVATPTAADSPSAQRGDEPEEQADVATPTAADSPSAQRGDEPEEQADTAIKPTAADSPSAQRGDEPEEQADTAIKPTAADSPSTRRGDAPEEQADRGWITGGWITGGRLRAHVNGAYQASVRQSEIEFGFRAYGEQARFLARERFQGGPHIDVGGSLRVWRKLVFGASYTQVSGSGSAMVTGTVPHPLDVGRDRTTTQTVALSYRERATAVYLGWRLPLRPALEMELSGGPSYLSLTRGVPANLIARETGGPPFAEVALQVETGEHTRNGVGFHAGIDITYLLISAASMPQLGIGFFARVTSGSVRMPLDADRSQNQVVGGIQTGAGLRLRF